MKTLKTLAILLIPLIARPLVGQDEIAMYIEEILASDGRTMTMNGSVFDVVAADFTTAATLRDKKAHEAYLRIAEAKPNGWAVRILAPDGTVMMTGQYADASLQVPNGFFSYYYVNGQVESSGWYTAGLKKGVWYRYTAWGTLLAERIYDGLGDEDVLLKNRWNQLAKAQ